MTKLALLPETHLRASTSAGFAQLDVLVEGKKVKTRLVGKIGSTNFSKDNEFSMALPIAPHFKLAPMLLSSLRDLQKHTPVGDDHLTVELSGKLNGKDVALDPFKIPLRKGIITQVRMIVHALEKLREKQT